MPLLAYLAVERETPHHRDALAELLWPTSTSAPALLRDVLSDLRRILDDRDAETPIIQITADTLQLNPTALEQGALWLDVAAFTALAADPADEARLKRAAALYRDDFLQAFALRNSPDYEAWILLRQETFRRTMLDTLYRLATLALQRGDYAAAQRHARRQLTLDNYSEEAHRQLLRALAFDGQRNRALAHYAAYVALLDEELGVAPDIRTTALYQRIRGRQIQSQSRATDFPPFVGREAELARLEDALHEAQRGAGQVRFVTGEAGSGKTMLTQAFRRRLLARGPAVTQETRNTRDTKDAVVVAGALVSAWRFDPDGAVSRSAPARG